MMSRRKRPGDFGAAGLSGAAGYGNSYESSVLPVAAAIPAPTRPFNVSSLAGEWDLNIPMSQSMNNHLEALGVTEMARIAADKLDISVKIEFPPGFVVITQDSLLGEKARKLPLDIESIDVMNSGVETLQTCHMESRAAFKVPGPQTIKWPGGTVIDTRTLEENGTLMKQVIQLTTADGQYVTTTRIFNRK